MSSPMRPPPLPKKTISGQFNRVKEYRAKLESISDHGFDEADELVDTLTTKIAAIDAELESGELTEQDILDAFSADPDDED